MIRQLDSLPEGLLKLNADQLYKKIDNHTLVHLEGKIKRPVFISILQHGDEHTGWDALRDYLNNHKQGLHRSISILFGNVQAARHNVRSLDNQPDFNRSWPNTFFKQEYPVAKTMQEITEIMKELNPFASVDIHNNSGRNPHYSGINVLNKDFINLASLFSDTMIYFTSPYGIQSGAFAPFCPSVTVECGLSGASDGTEQTHTFLELLMEQTNLSHVPGILEHQKVYKIVATVKVKPEIDISYKQHDHAFMLTKDLDVLNFHEINSGEVFGQLCSKLEEQECMPFIVTDENGNDVTDTYFEVRLNKIVSKTKFIPSMITQKISAIRQDCLCYIMQRINLDKYI